MSLSSPSPSMENLLAQIFKKSPTRLPFSVSAISCRYKFGAKRPLVACCACSYPTVAAVFQCTTDCTHKKKGWTPKMGPFKTAGGLYASGWQTAILSRGTAITLAHNMSRKSSLGISAKGEAPPPPPPGKHVQHPCPTLLWSRLYLEVPVGSELGYSAFWPPSPG